jgi:hypothetical protein
MNKKMFCFLLVLILSGCHDHGRDLAVINGYPYQCSGDTKYSGYDQIGISKYCVVDGKMNGEFVGEEFYKIQTAGEYKNDVPVGKWVTFDDGKPYRICTVGKDVGC